jgi:hypothetical protein
MDCRLCPRQPSGQSISRKPAFRDKSRTAYACTVQLDLVGKARLEFGAITFLLVRPVNPSPTNWTSNEALQKPLLHPFATFPTEQTLWILIRSYSGLTTNHGTFRLLLRDLILRRRVTIKIYFWARTMEQFGGNDPLLAKSLESSTTAKCIRHLHLYYQSRSAIHQNLSRQS